MVSSVLGGASLTVVFSTVFSTDFLDLINHKSIYISVSHYIVVPG